MAASREAWAPACHLVACTESFLQHRDLITNNGQRCLLRKDLITNSELTLHRNVLSTRAQLWSISSVRAPHQKHRHPGPQQVPDTNAMPRVVVNLHAAISRGAREREEKRT